MASKSREDRAIEQFTCPTCKARAGAVCVDRDGKPVRSMHGPGIHPLRRKLLGTINRIGTEAPDA
jgi:hypothetical protein